MLTIDDVLKQQNKAIAVAKLRARVDDELASDTERSEARQDLAAILSRASIELARRNSRSSKGGPEKFKFVRGARVRIA